MTSDTPIGWAIGLALSLVLMTGAASAVDYIKINIDPPSSPNGEHGAVIDIDKDDDGGNGGPAKPGQIDTSHNHDSNWTDLDPEVIGKLGPIGPGPATPKTPGGILVVDDTPPIVILDDGVGSNPGNPGFSPNGKTSPGALVIRLACSFGPAGLVIRNVGDLDAPIGLKLKWRAHGLGLDGTVRLDRPLRVGHSASLGGVVAEGAGCGLRLVS